MVGTKAGGLKASKTNIEKYGSQYYIEMGRKGGRVRCLKGFAKKSELADQLAGLEACILQERESRMVRERREEMTLRNKKTGEILEICKIHPERYSPAFNNSIAKYRKEIGNYFKTKGNMMVDYGE